MITVLIRTLLMYDHVFLPTASFIRLSITILITGCNVIRKICKRFRKKKSILQINNASAVYYTLKNKFPSSQLLQTQNNSSYFFMFRLQTKKHTIALILLVRIAFTLKKLKQSERQIDFIYLYTNVLVIVEIVS